MPLHSPNSHIQEKFYQTGHLFGLRYFVLFLIYSQENTISRPINFNQLTGPATSINTEKNNLSMYRNIVTCIMTNNYTIVQETTFIFKIEFISN
jgi:hypothetical protein